jgi:anaerobic magnesium-protoporphyrin IX monomethyl ester cyclase
LDILLTHAYFLKDDPVEGRVMKPYVPLGFISLAAFLEERGIRTGVFDATFSSPDDFASELSKHHPSVVGIYVTLMTRGSALKMAGAARAAGAKVVLGGPEPASYAEEFLHQGADVIVAGEAEETLTELVPALAAPGRSISGIAGIAYRDEAGAVVRNPPRPLLASIEQLPFPARDRVNIPAYLNAWRSAHRMTSLSINTMRGCPYTCRWCSHSVYGESYRRRPAARVAEEVAGIMELYHPDQLWFTDDVFTINHPWVFELQKEFARRGLQVSYECITRADRLNEEVLHAMKATGCTRVWIGSESGSQRILDAMDRRVKVEQVQAMSLLAQRVGIEVGMFLMLGYQGETKADIEATVLHVRRARPNYVLTTVAYPIRGTPYYDDLRAHLRLPAMGFAEWNDRMIEITNRYSRLFYWFANRRLINEASFNRALHDSRRTVGAMAKTLIKAKLAQAGMALVR